MNGEGYCKPIKGTLSVISSNPQCRTRLKTVAL